MVHTNGRWSLTTNRKYYNIYVCKHDANPSHIHYFSVPRCYTTMALIVFHRNCSRFSCKQTSIRFRSDSDPIPIHHILAHHMPASVRDLHVHVNDEFGICQFKCNAKQRKMNE